jgi:DNA-binding IclR family transcriptional regulator
MNLNSSISENSDTKNLNVQSVERALLLLQIIAKHQSPISIAKLTEISGLNRTTVWRLLCTLENTGFIERDVFTKGYALGFNATNLCPELMQQYAPLMRVSRPYLQKLSKEINEDILLTVPRFSGTLTIDQIPSSNAIRVKDYTNIISPLHCSSNGKLLLSYLDKKEVDVILNQQPLKKSTSRTIVDPDVLKGQLEQIRRDGYSYVLGENNEDENGISTPIFKGEFPTAFLNVSGPDFRFTLEKMLQIVPIMKSACEQISNQLSQF